MVAYNFQEQFAERVASLSKRQTIRPLGKRRHAKAGDALQLYTGMRTPKCRKLIDAMCMATAGVVIDSDPEGLPSITVSGKKLNTMESCAFATADGFTSAGEMVAWFSNHYNLPFEGVCIQW